MVPNLIVGLVCLRKRRTAENFVPPSYLPDGMELISIKSSEWMLHPYTRDNKIVKWWSAFHWILIYFTIMELNKLKSESKMNANHGNSVCCTNIIASCWGSRKCLYRRWMNACLQYGTWVFSSLAQSYIDDMMVSTAIFSHVPTLLAKVKRLLDDLTYLWNKWKKLRLWDRTGEEFSWHYITLRRNTKNTIGQWRTENCNSVGIFE